VAGTRIELSRWTIAKLDGYVVNELSGVFDFRTLSINITR
jgi:hypothetical protein